MTNQQFETLVNKLEKQAAANPKLYRMKVLLLTGLGFGYVFLFLALFLTLMVISILMLTDGDFTFGNVKVLLLTGALSFFIIKALIVKMEMPSGYYVQPDEAPELFKLIDTLRIKMNAPEIDEIVLDSEYNASVAQISKYGMIGKKKNVLMIGIPLLTTLTVPQFTAVLAHELAHISHSDTAFGAKIYRLRLSWARLLHSLEENEQFGTFIFKKFFQWYYPRFDAYTFTMARQEEYDADFAAATATSPNDLGEALAVISIAASYYYQDFYSELFEECAKTETVPQPYSNFIEKYHNLENKKAAAYFQDRLDREVFLTDTHPSMERRLSAIGVGAVIPTPDRRTAFEQLFAYPGRIMHDFNEMWIEFNEEHWKQEIGMFNESKNRYAELAGKQVTDLEEKLEKAYLTAEFAGLEAAIPFYEEIAHHHSHDSRTAAALLTLGDVYLGSEETAEKGIELINKGMSYDWELRQSGLDLLCGYYHDTENQVLFNKTLAELESWEQAIEAAEAECDFIEPGDAFVTHDKGYEEMALGIAQFVAFKEIENAYLVRKIISAIPERKQYVIGLDLKLPKGTDLREAEENLYEKYINGLGEFENACVIILNDKKDLRKSILKVENSLIYSFGEKEEAS